MARKPASKRLRPDTVAVHAGVDKDPAYSSVITPIYPSSTFRFQRLGVTRGYDYTRSGNPTRTALAENLAALEGGSAAWATCTGMSAETTVLFLLAPGDHVIAPHDLYGGTYRLMATCFTQMGVSFSFVDQGDLKGVAAAVRPQTRMLWIESPSNPLLRVVDIAALADLARRKKLITVVDNTFLSPAFQRPIQFGVDLVVHSTTKYINGHSDVVGGAIVAARAGELAERIGFHVNALGTACSPFDAWLVLRGVKTLGPRMAAHQRNAFAVAEFLASHRKVRRVYYPGLKGDPNHKLARRQQSGFGGVVSFELTGGRPAVQRLFSRLRLFAMAESLGGVESLIEHPETMSHASMSADQRKAAGLSSGTVRVSVGIEDPADLVEDLRDGLK